MDMIGEEFFEFLALFSMIFALLIFIR